MWQEFKKFLMRGDVISLAVAFIIGGAFQAIVNSFVADIVSPLLGMITGNPDFSEFKIGTVLIGNFINAVVNFVIVGFVLFILVKASGRKAE